MNTKIDMSMSCGLKDFEMWHAAEKGEISDADYDKWYEINCARCIYAHEICMYGETDGEESFGEWVEE